MEYTGNDIEKIFRESYNKLYGWTYRLTGSHENAEDVLQNAFLKACKNISGFNGESKLYTWICKIILNESRNYFQYMKKLPLIRITESLNITEDEFFDSLEAEYVPDYDDKLIVDEMREKCLHGFLKCMPQNQKICFLLKNCLELKNSEIAEIMGISEGNAKVLLHRGKKYLRELFEMRCNLIDPSKPCKCHLWIKYMNDNKIPFPEGYEQPRHEELKKEYFKNMDTIKKINYLYNVDPKYKKEDFVKNIKKIIETM